MDYPVFRVCPFKEGRRIAHLDINCMDFIDFGAYKIVAYSSPGR